MQYQRVLFYIYYFIFICHAFNSSQIFPELSLFWDNHIHYRYYLWYLAMLWIKRECDTFQRKRRISVNDDDGVVSEYSELRFGVVRESSLVQRIFRRLHPILLDHLFELWQSQIWVFTLEPRQIRLFEGSVSRLQASLRMAIQFWLVDTNF